MGVMKQLAEKRRLPQSKKQQSPSGSLDLFSFHPTKEQKSEIKALSPSLEELEDVLQSLADGGFRCSLKMNKFGTALALTISEDVPFGTGGRSISFFHADIDTLLKQVIWAADGYLENWYENKPSTNQSQNMDW